MQTTNQKIVMAYYMPNYNFAADYYNGRWVMVARQKTDTPAVTLAQISAIRKMAKRFSK